MTTVNWEGFSPAVKDVLSIDRGRLTSMSRDEVEKALILLIKHLRKEDLRLLRQDPPDPVIPDHIYQKMQDDMYERAGRMGGGL